MPLIERAPCHKMFVEFDTSIVGATYLLWSMAMIDLIDMRTNPRLRQEVGRRCALSLRGAVLPQSRGASPIQYESEPVDTWQAVSVIAEKFPRQTWVVDCDCVSPLWAAYWTERFRASPRVWGNAVAGVAISQPKKGPCRRDRSKLCGHGMAHAFTVLRDLPKAARDSLSGIPGVVDVEPDNEAKWRNVTVFDGSVLAGMDKPPASFYGRGESSARWITREEG